MLQPKFGVAIKAMALYAQEASLDTKPRLDFWAYGTMAYSATMIFGLTYTFSSESRLVLWSSRPALRTYKPPYKFT